MAKRTRVTDSERARIIAAFDSGKSCRQLASDFKRSPSTISAIAKDVGHEFGRSNLVRAQEAKAAYDDERRANLLIETVGQAERVLGQLFEPGVVFNFGGRDNTYNEREVDKPPPREQREISQTYKNLMSVVLEMDKRTAGTLDDAVFDHIAAAIGREADAYDAGDGSDAKSRKREPHD